MVESASVLSRIERERLLEDLLRSPAFGRSDQLRRLLRYVVTEEMEGRGPALSEYSVGVQALGRPPEYSPDIDSTVRTRAHELRKRLDEHYRQQPAEWRIELPRGTYQPRFVHFDAAPPPASESSRSEIPWRAFVAGVLAAGFLAVLAYAVSRVWESPGERAIRAVWGEAAERGSRVTVALSAPLQFWIRNLGEAQPPVDDPPFLSPTPLSPEFEGWYRKNGSGDPARTFLHPNLHSPLWGDAAGAIAITRFLAPRGVDIEFLAERNVRPAALRDRNAIVIGRAEYSYSMASLQPPGGYRIAYHPDRRRVAVLDPAGKAVYFREKGGQINYGIATMLINRTDRGALRTAQFSGINSDAAQAAVEYLSSGRHLSELIDWVTAQGRPMPASFQVVVRTTSRDTYSLKAERVAFLALE